MFMSSNLLWFSFYDGITWFFFWNGVVVFSLLQSCHCYYNLGTGFHRQYISIKTVLLRRLISSQIVLWIWQEILLIWMLISRWRYNICKYTLIYVDSVIAYSVCIQLSTKACSLFPPNPFDLFDYARMEASKGYQCGFVEQLNSWEQSNKTQIE